MSRVTNIPIDVEDTDMPKNDTLANDDPTTINNGNALVSQTQLPKVHDNDSPIRQLTPPGIHVNAVDGDTKDVVVDHQQQASDAAEGSGICGRGMWDAWTRSFDTPLMAVLDLLDNAVDASWTLLENPAVEKPQIQIEVDDQIGNGGILLRNASKFIPPLSEVLQVYKSKKGLCKDSIGENGIGVKHACASLSDLSLLFCKRDMKYLCVGILMRDLQQENSIVLPSFEWHDSVDIPDELTKLCTVTHPHTWGKALEAYGEGDIEDGMNQCFRHMMIIQEGQWRDHPNVFTIVLNELKHVGLDSTTEAHIDGGGVQSHREGKSSEQKSKELLNELQRKMPCLYLHLNNIEVKIQKKLVASTYWERRLVELTKFELEIPTEEHWTKIHREFYDKGKVSELTNPKKSIRFFCGFNPLRHSDEGEQASHDDVEAETVFGLKGDRNVNSASLKVYLYSRQSGRLIKVEHDPRSRMGLRSGSTDFHQGLTVIIDDYNGTIPLNATKQRHLIWLLLPRTNPFGQC
ncbi:hypothetical protein IV203_010561 [Nitzschia inconspicua]|uniref:Uncharacterized protein n=1 Tax=Nitzschia inconspicua TaxID=303405 RepID=A0A9K3KX33_9STRA|nr:hypothetical protein IV203_010561 [Nitzschia inconspicua]